MCFGPWDNTSTLVEFSRLATSLSSRKGSNFFGGAFSSSSISSSSDCGFLDFSLVLMLFVSELLLKDTNRKQAKKKKPNLITCRDLEMRDCAFQNNEQIHNSMRNMVLFRYIA